MTNDEKDDDLDRLIRHAAQLRSYRDMRAKYGPDETKWPPAECRATTHFYFTEYLKAGGN